MMPLMNGHNHPAPSLPLPEPLRQRPGLSLVLAAVLGFACDRCVPALERAAVQLAPRCPDPVRTVEAAKDCNPPCPAGQVCHKGDCVKVAADRQMTLASQPDEPTRVILEIRAR